jgi:hypothetical protein
MKRNKCKVIKEENIMEKYQSIANFIKKHLIKCIVFFIICAVVMPIIVMLAYRYSWHLIQPNEITADGMLSYIGAIFGGALTLFVAIIAIAQGYSTFRSESERLYKKRRDHIIPNLQIALRYDEKIELQISNLGDYAAINIYTYGYSFLFHFIKAGDTRTIKISFEDASENETESAIDGLGFGIDEDDFLKKINLFYSDIDNNYYNQYFVRDSANGTNSYCYDALPAEYL